MKISIIVPVYNGEKYLSKCLDSLVNQTIDEFEIIIINDGSTDSTPHIVNEYMKKYSNIRMISQLNKGLYYARKKGLLEAKGKYIGWVDADDFVELDMFECLYTAAVSNESDFVYCNYDFYPNQIKTKEKWFREFKGEVDVHFVERNSQPWNKLVEKKLLDELMIHEILPKCFDEAYIKVLMYSKRPTIINKKLYHYRINEGSMSNSYKNVNHYIRFINASIALKKHMNEWENQSTYWKDYFDYRIIYYRLQTIVVAANAGDKFTYNKTKKELLQASHNYKQNQHYKNILYRNFGKLRTFVIGTVIPSNYYIAFLICKTVFR